MSQMSNMSRKLCGVETLLLRGICQKVMSELLLLVKTTVGHYKGPLGPTRQLTGG